MNVLFLHIPKTHEDSIPFHLSFIYLSVDKKFTKDFVIQRDPLYYTNPEIYESQNNQVILKALMESPFYQEFWAFLRHNPQDVILLHCTNDDLIYTMCLSFLITKECDSKIVLISPVKETFYPKEIFSLIKPDYLVYQPSSETINKLLTSIEKGEMTNINGVLSEKNLKSKLLTTKPVEKKHYSLDPKAFINLNVIDIALKTIPAGEYAAFSKDPINTILDYPVNNTITQLKSIIEINEHIKKEEPVIINFIDHDFFYDPEYTEDFLNQLEKTDIMNKVAIQINTNIMSLLKVLKNNDSIIGWLKRNINHRITIDTHSFSDLDLKKLQLGYSLKEIKECISLLNENGLYHFHKINILNPFSSLESILENLIQLKEQIELSENKLIPQFSHYYLPIPSSPAYKSIPDESKNDLIIKLDEQNEKGELRIIHPIILNNPKIKEIESKIGYLNQQIYHIDDTPEDNYTINLQKLINYIKSIA